MSRIVVKKRLPWNILEPVKCPDMPPYMNARCRSLKELKRFNQAEPLAVDIETRGTNPALMFHHNREDTTWIVGLAVSNAEASCYFDKADLGDQWHDLLDWLEDCDHLFGHNVMFDGTFLYAENLLRHQDEWHEWEQVPKNMWLNWVDDTLILYRILAGEGFTGQQWGLKPAQKDLMLWKNTNEKDLNEWLVKHGYFKGPLKEELNNPEDRLHTYRHVKKKDGGRKITPDKGEMWRAPPVILGHYCCLDAFSTYMLRDRVLIPAMLRRFNDVMVGRVEDEMNDWMTHTRLHASQQLGGIEVDTNRFEQHKQKLVLAIQEVEDEFLTHEAVRNSINTYNQIQISKVRDKEPDFISQGSLPKESKEPAKLTKAGKESANWVKSAAKTKLRENMLEYPFRSFTTNGKEVRAVSANWVNWKERMQKAQKTQHFNINSGTQLEWLFYEQLDFPVLVRTDKDNPASDEKAKQGWGEPGRLLIQADKMAKELSYVQAAIDNTIEGILHPGFKMAATVSRRLAGGGDGFSIHQQPKVREYLKGFHARAGKKIVQADFSAIEDVMLAEVTRDKKMLQLLDSKTDGYIWTGAHLPVIGPKFKEAGFDPDKPDPVVVKFIKKNMKGMRAIAKKVKLGKNYGMGWRKLQADLAIEGIELSDTEAKGLIDGLNELHDKAYIQFPAQLQEDWLDNGGFIINGLGLPCSVAHSAMKDLPNRFMQSTAHSTTVKSGVIMEQVLIDAGYHMMWWPGAEKHKKFVQPWIWDFHDEHMVEASEAEADTVAKLYDDRLVLLNEWLGGSRPIDGDPEIGDSLDVFKCE
jgi:hypothetical protein